LVPPPRSLHGRRRQVGVECALMGRCGQSVMVMERKIRPTLREVSWVGVHRTERLATIVPSPFQLRVSWTDLPIQHPNCLGAHIHQCAFLILLRPPVVQTERRWYRNIYLLSIAYAFRPRLRSRLTLSGRAFLRKP